MPSVPNMEVIIYNKNLIANPGYDLPLDLYKQEMNQTPLKPYQPLP
ncbi:MAG: hypothetical protein ACLR56_03170 [Oscillospiraceae bacterium]